MSLRERILAIIFALVAASVVTFALLAIGIVVPYWTESDRVERLGFFVTSFFATSFWGASAIVPALVLTAVAEVLAIRSAIYYALAGALVGLISYFGSDISLRLENTTDIPPVDYALSLALAAGVIGGLTYWLIAGRRAHLRKSNIP